MPTRNRSLKPLALAAALCAVSLSASAAEITPYFQGWSPGTLVEANAIGTAILRADLYPDSVRGLLRDQFKTYLHQRIAFFTVGAQYDSAIYWENEAGKTAAQLWGTATQYARSTKDLIPSGQMIPALNAAFDAATSFSYFSK